MSDVNSINSSISTQNWSKKKATNFDQKDLQELSKNQSQSPTIRDKGANFSSLNYGDGLYGNSSAKSNSSEPSTGIANKSQFKSKLEKQFSGDGPSVELAGSIKDLSATKVSENDSLLKEAQKINEPKKGNEVLND